jgi:formate/nitrite transporter FocA (FNT family)
MLQHWLITFWGNLAGSLLVVGLITGYGTSSKSSSSVRRKSSPPPGTPSSCAWPITSP